MDKDNFFLHMHHRYAQKTHFCIETKAFFLPHVTKDERPLKICKPQHILNLFSYFCLKMITRHGNTHYK